MAARSRIMRAGFGRRSLWRAISAIASTSDSTSKWSSGSSGLVKRSA